MSMNGDMPHSIEEWRHYQRAAERKVRMAAYHLQMLESRLAIPAPRLGPDIPIEVQAHFEGILYSFIAASDQLAEAINRRFTLGLENASLGDALAQMPRLPIRRRLITWFQSPIAADVRDIRRRAAHHHYAKTPLGPKLVVQEPTGARPYGGSRTLDGYGQAAVEHLGRLEELLQKFKETADSRAGHP